MPTADYRDRRRLHQPTRAALSPPHVASRTREAAHPAAARHAVQPRPTALRPARAGPAASAAAPRAARAHAHPTAYLTRLNLERGNVVHQPRPAHAAGHHGGRLTKFLSHEFHGVEHGVANAAHGLERALSAGVHTVSRAEQSAHSLESLPQREIVDLIAAGIYAPYYLSYRWGIPFERGVAQQLGPSGYLLRGTVGTILTALEALGVGGDITLDFFVKHEPVGDEGKRGAVYPWHSIPHLPRSFRGPQRRLPGMHRDGKIDWRWG